MKETIETPNGFTSWYETFYEIVEYITYVLFINTKETYKRLIFIQDEYGQGGLYELSKSLTDKFELQYKDVEWGLDERTQYYDTIDEFLEKELK